MKAQTNVMSLAWKIFKTSKFITEFYYALKLAWKIAKRVSVNIQDTYINFTAKNINKNKFYTEHTTPTKNTLQIENDEYNFNMFITELMLILR